MSPDFFQKAASQGNLLQKWDTLGKWSSEAFPIYEWDGLLYVAFSSAHPPKVKKVIPVVFVMSTTAVLAPIWNRLRNGGKGNEPSFEAPALENPENTSAINVPELTGSRINHLMPSPEAPEGFDLGSAHIPELSSPMDHELDLLNSPEEVPVVAPDLSSSRSRGASGNPSKAGSELSNVTVTTSSAWAGLLGQMEFHFLKYMILLIDGDIAHPWQWSDKFFCGQDPQVIPLTTPSPFRVVLRTNKSYHGQVVNTATGEAFFDLWNEGQTPDHLTLAAIQQDDKLMGILLGIGDREANTRHSLLAAEKLAQEIAKMIIQSPEILSRPPGPIHLKAS